MTDFQKKLINKLLDQFERSQQSWKDGVKARVVRLNVEKDILFKNYAHSSTAYLFRPDIERDIKSLEQINLIIAKRDKQTGLLKTVDLNLDVVLEAYSMLKRVPLNTKLDDEMSRVQTLLLKYGKSLLINKYLNHIGQLIESHKSRKSYYDTIDELQLTVQIIDAIENQNEDVFLRVFSKKRFGDSKLIERKGSKIMQIFNEFGEIEYDNISDLLEDYNIVKNKGNAIAKQGITFRINNQTINLDLLNEEFYFSMDMLVKMDVVALSKPKVITVENLTSFYAFKDDKAIILYLGGFHNSAKRELIKKIHAFNPNLEFYHTGDIDCGGFEILIDLRNKTGINFKPFLMNVEQLKKYKYECQKLTDNDRKRLIKLSNDSEAVEFKEVIEYMLCYDVKLEQESIE